LASVASKAVPPSRLAYSFGFEVGHAHHDRLGPEGGRDGADALGQALNEKAAPIGVAASHPGQFQPGRRVGHPFGMQQRQRVGLDGLADNEFHPGQSHAVAGQERGLEGQVRVAEVDHDPGLRARQDGDLGALDAEG
jgi:hypothetical protein